MTVSRSVILGETNFQKSYGSKTFHEVLRVASKSSNLELNYNSKFPLPPMGILTTGSPGEIPKVVWGLILPFCVI